MGCWRAWGRWIRSRRRSAVRAGRPLSRLDDGGALRVRLTRRDWVRLLLLWLGGIDLRLTLLAVPPLIPLIHRELHLDEKSVGALVSLPVLLFATAAVPGSLLIPRLGVRGALMPARGLVPASGATPALPPSTPLLFPPPFLMRPTVAVSPPAF